ncbi:MAG: LysR substrate-binding domain-containing protein [Gammaproteobacteria bacterium]
MNKLASMKVFATVVQTGSFSAAAEKLALSKAMVSKQIHALEDLLGARVLNRTNRRLHLTEAGATYLEKCKKILTAVEEAERAVMELNTEPRGALKLRAPSSLGTFHLVPAIADYEKRYPAVKVLLSLQDPWVDLVEEGLDLAIRLGKLPDSSLVARQLASVQAVVCGAPAYLKAHGMPRTPDDLAQHNCLIYTEWTPKGEWLFKGPEGEFLVSVSGDFEANLGDAVRMAALSGRGLVQLLAYVVGSDLRAGRLRAVLTDYAPDKVSIHAVYPHREHLAATVRTFVEFLQERFQKDPDWGG